MYHRNIGSTEDLDNDQLTIHPAERGSNETQSEELNRHRAGVLCDRVVLALFRNNRTGIAQLTRATDADAYTDAGCFTESQSLSHPYTRA
jgi:hypothetical protein